MLPKGVECKETGHADMISRIKAARKLLNNLAELNYQDLERLLGTKSATFIDQQQNLFAEFDNIDLVEMNKPTAKQYFWIKDCADKLTERG